MSILVVNCFHWIGYHMITHFLNEGIYVDGIDEANTEKKEFLSMFVGRNHLFNHLPTISKKNYTIAFVIGEYEYMEDIQAANIVRISHQRLDDVFEHGSDFYIPFLIGEWMPMNQKGVYINDILLPFTSKQFLSETIDITDFISQLMEWLTEKNKRVKMEVKSMNVREGKHSFNHKHFYVQENRSKKEVARKLMEHYQRYTFYYHDER